MHAFCRTSRKGCRNQLPAVFAENERWPEMRTAGLREMRGVSTCSAFRVTRPWCRTVAIGFLQGVRQRHSPTLPARQARSWAHNSERSFKATVRSVMLEHHVQKLSAGASRLFPVWLTLASLLALWFPSLFLWFKSQYVTFGLALTMLSMGTTLTLEDFAGVLKQGFVLPLGGILQYTIMPLMGFLVSRLAVLPKPMAVGVCLVASCPGGVASNIVTYLAGADVPLSVLMTTLSTLMAIIATPALVKILVDSIVPVNAAALVSSTFQVVLLPVGLGAYLNQTFPSEMKRCSPFAPLLAVSMTVLICASIMAANAQAVKEASWKLVAAIFMLHSGGFGLGYIVARMLGIGIPQARTISIEVGMQNSTLGAVLAAVHFKDPLTAVPCAISACMHSLLGSALAMLFRLQDARTGKEVLGLQQESTSQGGSTSEG